MSTPTIPDLQARITAIKNAPMIFKAQHAEAALESFMQYLAALEHRICQLEKGENRGTE